MSRPRAIILITTDQQRWDTLGSGGHPVVKTPHIDMLAARGTVCTNAFCVSPLCVPSRTSLFAGDYVHRTGAVDNEHASYWTSVDDTLLGPLRAIGYRLALIGKNHAFHPEQARPDFDIWEEYAHWGKVAGTNVEAFPDVKAFRMEETRFPGIAADDGLMEGLIEGPDPFPPEACVTHRIVDDAIDFIDRQGDDPFFLYLSFPDPHFPNIVCEPYHSMYDPATFPPLPGADIDWEGHPFAHYVQSQTYDFPDYMTADIQRLLATYYGQITFIDTELGRFFDRLRAVGLWDQSLITFTSDHGDFGGQFGHVGKTKAFYEPLIRIPLVLALPGEDRPQRLEASISNIDIMPTILDHCGLAPSRPPQGRSFLAALTGGPDVHRDEIIVECGRPVQPPPPMAPDAFQAYQSERLKQDGLFWFIDYTVNGRAAMIRRDGWKYAWYVGDRDELYDLTHDPLELHNLSDAPEHREQREALRNRLLEWLLTEPVRGP